MKGQPKQRTPERSRRWTVPALLILLITLLAACAQVRLPAAVPDIQSFTADPEVIAAGDDSTLSWEVVGADTHPGQTA